MMESLESAMGIAYGGKFALYFEMQEGTLIDCIHAYDPCKISHSSEFMIGKKKKILSMEVIENCSERKD